MTVFFAKSVVFLLRGGVFLMWQGDFLGNEVWIKHAIMGISDGCRASSNPPCVH
jgi:hypothetical protein